MSEETPIGPGPSCPWCGEEYGMHVPNCPLLARLIKQPAKETAEDIEAQVCADIRKRQELGLTKYGVSVANNPLELKEWLNHAYTEALDLAIYLKRTMDEVEKKENL